jgi:peptide/nickel transport system permease protein
LEILSFTAKKLLAVIPVLLSISVFAFLLGVAAPGDPAYFTLIADGATEPTEAEIAATRARLGLDRPMGVRYLNWLGGALTGDFGSSFMDGRPVGREILNRLPVTLHLSLVSLGVAVFFGIGLGVLMAAFADGPVDRLGQTMALGLISVPGFWLAILMIGLFSEHLHWLPSHGMGTWVHLWMPSCVMAAGTIGLTMRICRASLLAEMHKAYIVTVRSKGVRERFLYGFHGLPNALIPVVTVLGTFWGNLLGGAVIVETIFGIPGIGQYAITSIMERDFPVVQAYVLLTGGGFVLVNLGIDLLYMALNPRIRFADKGAA